MTEPAKRNSRKKLIGIVTSDKMDKTIVVDSERTVKHPLFKKYLRRHTRVYAHDENNEAATGDKVELMESRPLSKKKSFRLIKVLARARIPSSTPQVETTLLESPAEAKQETSS